MRTKLVDRDCVSSTVCAVPAMEAYVGRLRVEVCLSCLHTTRRQYADGGRLARDLASRARGVGGIRPRL